MHPNYHIAIIVFSVVVVLGTMSVYAYFFSLLIQALQKYIGS